MQIPIKQLVLEGSSYEEIVENIIEEGAKKPELQNYATEYGPFKNKPRVISSAKQ